MKKTILLEILLGAFIILAAAPLYQLSNEQRDICYFITRHGYPCEVYLVQTTDGYILSTVRIRHSTQGTKQKDADIKPVVFIKHGIMSSSDSWLLNGPNDGLAFMLADAGYDVWLGNARGTVYSRRHVSRSTLSYTFWDFDWHEIGVYDLPAMIDYILLATHQTSLHYVAHSQGTTEFLVWLSTLPHDSSKIKSCHLLAPIGYVEHMTLPFVKPLAAFLGQPGSWTNAIAPVEFAARTALFETLSPNICYEGSVFQEFCIRILILLGGCSRNLNVTMLADIAATHPSGTSKRQIIHTLQLYNSGYFRQYDYGRERNIEIYKAETPPDYRVELIKIRRPIDFYYSDRDDFTSVTDVHRLVRQMADGAVELHRVQAPAYNHLDFIVANNVKEVINNCVLSKIQNVEGVSRFDNNSCFHLLTTRFH